MSQPSFLPGIIAALLWDRRGEQLNLSPDEGAHAFVAALDPPPYEVLEPAVTPLSIAALMPLLPTAREMLRRPLTDTPR